MVEENFGRFWRVSALNRAMENFGWYVRGKFWGGSAERTVEKPRVPMSLETRFGPSCRYNEARLDWLQAELVRRFTLKLDGRLTDDGHARSIIRLLISLGTHGPPAPNHSPYNADANGIPTALLPGHFHILFKLEQWQLQGLYLRGAGGGGR